MPWALLEYKLNLSTLHRANCDRRCSRTPKAAAPPQRSGLLSFPLLFLAGEGSTVLLQDVGRTQQEAGSERCCLQFRKQLWCPVCTCEGGPQEGRANLPVRLDPPPPPPPPRRRRLLLRLLLVLLLPRLLPLLLLFACCCRCHGDSHYYSNYDYHNNDGYY